MPARPFIQDPLLLLTIFFLMALPASAIDYHVLPDGLGQKDGSSWDNAFDTTVLERLDRQVLKPGDRLLIGSGDYANVSMIIACSGTEDSPITITGVDRGDGLPRFVADWQIDRPDTGATAIKIESGVRHVSLRELRIEHYQHGVMAGKTEPEEERSHLTFENVKIQQVRHGFYLSDCDDLRLVACEVKRYSKHAYRFEQGCDRVQVRQCVADCSEGDPLWEEQTEHLPFGFTVNASGAPNTAFVFEDCLAQNNLMPKQPEKYKNGDGFVVEDSARDVVFIRCRALRNQDGGFDLKVLDVHLTGCVGIGNGRNFRIWSTGTLTNCFSGWANTGLWCNGGPVTVSRSTFYDHAHEAIQTDDGASKPVTLTDCLLAKIAEIHRRTSKGTAEVGESNVVDPSPDGGAAGFVSPSDKWDGLGDAMDSRLIPAKGYSNNR
jgi:hypothetical protein